ncbi:MAG: hypothetical protein C0501_23345 [Isosphaera sp.]|nr:hypothetical protein [Isosphaera sp.]
MRATDPTPRPTGKDLANRYKYTDNREYVRRPGGPTALRTGLAVVAGLAVVSWAAAEVVFPTRMAYQHTHGTLANPHAPWDADCAQCHNPHSVSKDGVLSVLNVRDRWHDLTCEKCHKGPAHHAAVTPDGEAFHKRCSNCHHDHNGRDHSLVRIADSHCTVCHADLARNHAGTPKEGLSLRVTAFAPKDAHPEFRAVRERMGPTQHRPLKFSHPLHMSPGQARGPDDKARVTVARLKELAGRGEKGEAAARRYAPGQDDPDLVQLDCKSCHQLDGGDGDAGVDRLKKALADAGESARGALPPRGDGAHFLPVNFEAHCRACHPLRAPAGVADGKVVPGFDVPHRRKVSDLRNDLKAGYLRGMLTADLPSLTAPPGPGDDRPKLTAGSLRLEVDRMAAVADHFLLGKETSAACGCVECHQTRTDGEVVPVPDKTVWFPGAYFNHAAHRSLGSTPAACATCHPGTEGHPVPVRTLDRDALIRGADTCRQCHSPAGTEVTLRDGDAVTRLSGGGIRHGCTDCHRYHNGDHALQGRGAWVNFPEPLGLDKFLPGYKRKD